MWWSYITLLTDGVRGCPTRTLANIVAGGSPVWRFLYSHTFADPLLGPFRAATPSRTCCCGTTRTSSLDFGRASPRQPDHRLLGQLRPDRHPERPRSPTWPQYERPTSRSWCLTRPWASARDTTRPSTRSSTAPRSCSPTLGGRRRSPGPPAFPARLLLTPSSPDTPPGREVVAGGRPEDTGRRERLTPRHASIWATRDFSQDRCLARLGLGVRRLGSLLGCPPVCGCGSLSVCRPPGTVDEAWLQRGLPCS